MAMEWPVSHMDAKRGHQVILLHGIHAIVNAPTRALVDVCPVMIHVDVRYHVVLASRAPKQLPLAMGIFPRCQVVLSTSDSKPAARNGDGRCNLGHTYADISAIKLQRLKNNFCVNAQDYLVQHTS